MKLCLIISGDAERRENMRDIVENLGLIAHESADGHGAVISVNALMPDVILLDSGTPGVSEAAFLKDSAVLKNGKRPVIMYCVQEDDAADTKPAEQEDFRNFIVDKPDIKTFARRLLQQGLLHEHVRAAMGIERRSKVRHAI